MSYKEKMLEMLADNEHATWSSWMVWLFSISEKNQDGTVTISEENVRRWNRQAATPYHMLSEKEKESDRKQVREVLEQILATLPSETEIAKENIKGFRKYYKSLLGSWKAKAKHKGVLIDERVVDAVLNELEDWLDKEEK